MRSSSPVPQRFSLAAVQVDNQGREERPVVRLPKAESSSPSIALASAASHSIYSATAGTLIIRDDEDQSDRQHRLRRLCPDDLRAAARDR